MKRRLLVIECAGLDMAAVASSPKLAALDAAFRPLQPVFPAVTCTAQATMRTALPPAKHNIIANGRFDRRSGKVEFWNQSAWLYSGERIWEKARAKGTTVAVMFTQQSLGDCTDYCLSPAPIHKHHGDMIMACQTRPPTLEQELYDQLGSKFKLFNYWGPLASRASGEWCAKSTAALMNLHQPDILFTYLSNMDYCLQREGPHGKSIGREADYLADSLSGLLATAKEFGYEVVVWGDYAITEAHLPVYPNKVLLDAGLFVCRELEGMLYPNIFDSRAFAMCDHQVAHVYVRDKADVAAARQVLAGVEGIETIQTAAEAGLDSPEAGELVLTAKSGTWFAYSWWETKRQAPDYATHVDIHSKIGFDPCELFWHIPFISTSLDCTKVKGTHGRIDTPAVFAVTAGIKELENKTTLLELSSGIRDYINGELG
ncbi:MAG: alkaline phosphatase family protein [Victivallales bacterium]|nr:alkaline phosphatase family protein [Victivallales bacterium]